MTLIGAICINLYLSFRSADATADLVTDRTLLASARVIAEATHVDGSGTVQIDIPPAALEMFDTGYGDRVFYQVVTAWGISSPVFLICHGRSGILAART